MFHDKMSHVIELKHKCRARHKPWARLVQEIQEKTKRKPSKWDCHHWCLGHRQTAFSMANAPADTGNVIIHLEMNSNIDFVFLDLQII